MELQKYLESLSKEELIKLVTDFAPDKFLKSIELKDISGKEASKIFDLIEKKIKSLFPVRNYCSSVEVEEPLKELLDEIALFYNKEPERIFNLILFILEELEDAVNDGMFHHYEHDGNFEYYDVNKFILEFLEKLDSKQKMKYLYEILQNSEYSYLSFDLTRKPDFFSEEDKSNFKQYLHCLNHVGKDFYVIFGSALNFQEKENFLMAHKSNKIYAHELFKLYYETGNTEKLVSFTEECIEQFRGNNTEFISSRIILADQLKQDKIPWIEKSIKAYHGGETLKQLFEYIPSEKKGHYEKLLKNEQTKAFISYLELEGRLAGVVEIFDTMKINSSIQENFFKKYKEQYPEKAVKIFKQALDESLEHTGDRAYYQVIEILSQLKSLYDTAKFKDLLVTIKVKYKRRTNLVKMIRKRFY